MPSQTPSPIHSSGQQTPLSLQSGTKPCRHAKGVGCVVTGLVGADSPGSEDVGCAVGVGRGRAVGPGVVVTIGATSGPRVSKGVGFGSGVGPSVVCFGSRDGGHVGLALGPY